MRIVLGLLLAVNLLLFFWISQSANETDTRVSELATNMPPLRLLSEKEGEPVKVESSPPAVESVKAEISPPIVVEPEPVSEIIEEPAEKSIETPVVAEKAQPSVVFIELGCYSLGPFSVENHLKSVSSSLNELGIASVKRYETRRELSGFWVYIPPLPSRADAQKVVSMLKERGVKDYLIVPTGVKKHAISLGFFRTREGAQQHKTHMQTLGLAPVMDDSYKESSGFWLDFTSSNTPALPNQFVNALQAQYDGISMKKRQCLE